MINVISKYQNALCCTVFLCLLIILYLQFINIISKKIFCCCFFCQLFINKLKKEFQAFRSCTTMSPAFFFSQNYGKLLVTFLFYFLIYLWCLQLPHFSIEIPLSSTNRSLLSISFSISLLLPVALLQLFFSSLPFGCKSLSSPYLGLQFSGPGKGTLRQRKRDTHRQSGWEG